MLAMLGLTMAGAGVMKSQSAQKKQQELAQEKAVAQAQLATAKAEQAQTASVNWEKNQTMQASATQKVYTKVVQSQANIDFWASYVAWKIKVAEAEEKRRQAELEARIKAYYAALRLRPVSSQPAQPLQPSWATLFTRARAMQINRRNNASQSGAGSSANGGGAGSSETSKLISSAGNAKMAGANNNNPLIQNKGGGFLGGLGMMVNSTANDISDDDTTDVGNTFSYRWGDNNLQQSQEDEDSNEPNPYELTECEILYLIHGVASESSGAERNGEPNPTAIAGLALTFLNDFRRNIALTGNRLMYPLRVIQEYLQRDDIYGEDRRFEDLIDDIEDSNDVTETQIRQQNTYRVYQQICTIVGSENFITPSIENSSSFPTYPVANRIVRDLVDGGDSPLEGFNYEEYGITEETDIMALQAVVDNPNITEEKSIASNVLDDSYEWTPRQVNDFIINPNNRDWRTEEYNQWVALTGDARTLVCHNR